MLLRQLMEGAQDAIKQLRRGLAAQAGADAPRHAEVAVNSLLETPVKCPQPLGKTFLTWWDLLRAILCSSIGPAEFP